MVVAGTPPWLGAPPWALPAPLGRVCVPSCRGERDRIRFVGGFSSHHGVVWDVLGVRWSVGMNSRACKGSAFLGCSMDFGALTPLRSSRAPHCFVPARKV